VTRASLAALLAAIEADQRAAHHHADVVARYADRLAEETGQIVVAASLHHFYAAVESALERVSQAFDMTPPTGPRWHQALLDLAALDVPEVRPAVVSEPTVKLLRRLLAFRRFFRNAYAASWDPTELRHNVETLRDVLPHLDEDLARFGAHIRHALSHRGEDPNAVG